MSWPPEVGEVLQHAEEATGVREKLAGYSLNPQHEDGAASAKAKRTRRYASPAGR